MCLQVVGIDLDHSEVILCRFWNILEIQVFQSDLKMNIRIIISCFSNF